MSIAALLSSFVAGQAYWNQKGQFPKCLNCKYLDETSDFGYSYSYCKDRNICVKDQWNYINQWCKTKWIPGWMIDVNQDCEAEEITVVCPDFTSLPYWYGKNDTRKNGLILPEGAMCTMTIDATAAVARVKITEAEQMGVLWNQYDRDEWITVPEGYVQ